MDLGLKNKTALVFGAGGGLGGAIARSLAREGANLAIADIDKNRLAAAAREFAASGVKVLPLEWDLASLSVIEDRVAAIEGRLGRVSVLVNNTGGPPPTSAHGQSPELWRKHFEAMVLSVIAITDRVLPKMIEAKWGRIVTSTSSGVVAPIPNLAVSNALRMSLVGWSKSLAREVARAGVTVNVILPGRIATQRIRFLDEQKAHREGRSVSDIERESTASIPAGRYGEPHEYGDAVAFLASTQASYITGSILRVDGGLIASI